MNHGPFRSIVSSDCWQRPTSGVFARRVLATWALSHCLAFVVGCGGTVQEAAAPSATEDAPAAAGETPTSPQAVGEVSSGAPQVSATTQAPTATDVATPKLKKLPAPTPEQIARWTPAPFEPLQLLAIREWEKTSFTACLAATADGEHFIVAGSRVVLWSVAKDAPEHVFLELTSEDQERELLSLAVSPDGKWFAVGDSTGLVRIWSLEDRSEIVAKQLGQNGISYLAISPDAEEIATISYDSEISIWSADALAPKNQFKVDTNSVNRMEYMAPQMLAAAGESTSLWNTSTGERVQELTPGRYSFALGRSPDGTRFIFGSDESLHLWNVAESKDEAEIKQGVSGDERLAFSPDGKFLATTNGGSVQLWNLAEGRITQVIDSFGWPIVGVSWLPKSNLVAVASDIGCTRIWGTPSQGAALGMKPLHAPVAMPDVDSQVPATQAQLEQVIDLRTFPRLPGSESSMVSMGNFSCVTTASADEAQAFYHYFLEQAGWKGADTPSANPAARAYRQQGFMLSVYCYDAGDGKTNVSLDYGGNYDLRWIPKFDAAPVEIAYEQANSVSYRTQAELLQIETALLRTLHAAGWAGYTRANSSHSEYPDQRDMNFLRNGTSVRVSIGKFPVAPESYTIQYSLFPNDCAAPVPPDSGFVEFDGSTDPVLVATTKLTLDQARAFYDSELAKQGWLVREQGQSLKEDHCWLSYIRNQCNLTVGLTKLPDGRTLVRIGDASSSLWENSQAEEEPAEEDGVGLEAADFPAVADAKPATYDVISKSIEIQVDKATLADVAERFSKALSALGWQPEQGGIRDEQYTLLTFKKDEQEITLRARSQDGNAMVSFQGDGLLWNKELPTGKQIVSYETWLLLNKHPAGLEFLDAYEAEMRAISAP